MTDRPNILQVADRISKALGKDITTPLWRATHAGFYGLELEDAAKQLLAHATGIPAEQWNRHQRRAFHALWVRVGRRGRKSLNAALIAVFEMAFGQHERFLLPSEVGLVAIISKDLAGASIVRRFIRMFLEALGFTVTESMMGAVRILAAEGLQIQVASFACDSTAPRGYPICVLIYDELAHWSFEDGSPANGRDIDAAASPGQAQFPDWRKVGISTPLSTEDLHFEMVEAAFGNPDAPHMAVVGPTWEWAPEINEATCVGLCPDSKRRSMEFGAIPGASLSNAFDGDDTAAAFRPVPEDCQLCEPVISTDPSSGKGDAFVSAPVQWAIREGAHPLLVVGSIDAVEGKFYGTVSLAHIAGKIAKRARLESASVVVGDQREALGLESAFRDQREINYYSLAWTNAAKCTAVARLRRLFAERAIILPVGDDVLKRELGRFQERLLPSGFTTYAARRKGHDDRVAIILTALIADSLGYMSGSPVGTLDDGSLITICSERSLTPGRITYHGDGMIDSCDSVGILGELQRRLQERRRRLADDTLDD